MRHELIHAFLYISIHAPTRGATKWIPCCGQSAHISIHAPARGATNSASMMSALSLFQSTLPQGERPIPWPAEDWKRIFQSTLPQGERPKIWLLATPKKSFQSTLPQGERRGQLLHMSIQPAISIHAPTRGATEMSRQSMTFPRFQSTLPQGERRFYPGGIVRLECDFNPRSHKGSDLSSIANRLQCQPFQSTLPQGERQGVLLLYAGL